MGAAILDYHLAIDVTGLVRNQKAGQVRKFAMLAGTAERIALYPAFIAALGAELARSAGRRKCAGGDRDRAHTLGSPFHRKAPGHREHRGFRHRRRHREGAAGDRRGREDAQHHAAVLAVDPAPARGERAIHRAVQRRRQNRIRCPRRQMFGLRNEGRGGIIDQHIDRRLAPYLFHHRIDRSAVADIAADHAHLAAEFAAHPRGRRLQQFEPAAANDQLRAELDEAVSHRRPEPRTATCDQYPLSRQQALFKHCPIPFLPVIARSDSDEAIHPAVVGFWIASLRSQ